MASPTALQTGTDLRTCDRFFLAPLEASELTLDSRLWEMVLALGVAEEVSVLAEVLDVDEDEIYHRLETLEALGVLDAVHDQAADDAVTEPESIAPGSLGALVDADEIDVDPADLADRSEVAADDTAVLVPADLVELEHDDDEMRALVYRFLGSFED